MKQHKSKKIFGLAKVYVTRRCNLKCSYCHASSSDQKNELSVPEWKTILDGLSSIADTINLFGGEPTLYEGLPELIKYCADKKYHFSLGGTNGSQSPDYYVDLGKRGLPLLMMSCDGFKEDHCLDSSSWKKTKRALEIAQEIVQKNKSPMILAIDCVISPKNIKIALDLGRHFSKFGIFMCYAYLQHGKNRFLSMDTKSFPFVTKQDYHLQITDFAHQIVNNRNDKDICWLDPLSAHEAAIEFASLKNRWKCQVPMLTIDYNGSCMSCYDRPAVNLSNWDWKKVFHDPRLAAKLAQQDQKECEGCFWGCYWLSEMAHRGELDFGKEGFI